MMGIYPSIFSGKRVYITDIQQSMKHFRVFVFLVALAASSLSHAKESWLGLYLEGKKIGFASSIDVPDKVAGKACVRTDTRTFISANLMGSSLTMDISSSSYVVSGKPLKMVFNLTSSGRTQKLEAKFSANQIDVSVTNGGATSKKTIAVPKDGKVVDDPIFNLDVLRKGSQSVVYVLDPLTASLVKNTVINKGVEAISVAGKKQKATRIDIAEVRANTKVYLDSKGQLVIAFGPMGIEMRPMSKVKAMAASSGGQTPDLADLSAIKPDKPISNPGQIAELTLRISGKDLSSIPSGDHQTVQKDGNSWIVTIHPAMTKQGVLIETAAAQKPEWTKPSLNMPSDSALFRQKAKEIVGDSKTIDEAASKIHRFVHELMVTNAGIGVIRDATEILKTKEGVCRDHAILTCTLFRAAGIPARLASGLVYQDGFFYYHAWIEAWNDGKWIGVDSTRALRGVTAAHVKLAEGNVDDAFVFTFLEKSKISVLRIAR